MRPELAKVIRQTAERGGSMVVPAFAVERTQKFVFMLKELMETGQIPRLPVYCDSPMAIKAVEIYLKHESEYTDEARALILILSRSSTGSSHVGKELERASSKRKPIITVRVDAAQLTPAFEYFLSESQWVDLEAYGREPGFARLADVFAALDDAYPGIRFRMVDEAGRVRPHVQVFVDAKVERNPAAELKPGAQIMIVGALSGG